MRAKLFIYLQPDSSGAASWVRVEEPARQSLNVGHGTLQDIAAVSAGCRIIALVPGADVLLAIANIPAGNRQRAMNAIPYALEDQLATDVDTLHFALGERLDNTRIHAAAVDRAPMDSWLDTLRQAHIEPDVITSEILALPWPEARPGLAATSWVILVNGNKALVRTGPQTGWVADIGNLDALLRIALQESSAARPEQVRVIHCTPATTFAPGGMPTCGERRDAQEPPELLADTGITVDVEHSDEAMLSFLGRAYNEKNAINLLQGSYNRREQLGKLWKPWRPALAMLALLLMIQSGMTIADYLHLKTENDALTQQIAQTYLRTFPDARKVVNPRAQMEQRLKELRGNGIETGGFISLLGDIGPSLKETPGIEIQRINYANAQGSNAGKIDLALSIGDLQSLDQLKQRLTTQGKVTVSIESAASRDNKVEARLQITGQNPG
jgi:general secretion pathway protein L